MNGPLNRVDAALVTAIAAAPGLESIAHAAERGGSSAAAAVRWVSEPVIVFGWGEGLAFLTPTDVVAIGSGVVLFIRFGAWALAPLFGRRAP